MVPVGDQPLILAADKFAGQVVVITLCAAVKAVFFYRLTVWSDDNSRLSVCFLHL
ncbi:hypothetical protein G753_03643 [Escherichia coli HVH 91 (4-4638751)]|nr:hypothetical protein G753_03643 [Escherichia coli HVH 91 (4-4638751)]